MPSRSPQSAACHRRNSPLSSLWKYIDINSGRHAANGSTNYSSTVIPAKAGIQMFSIRPLNRLDSRLRGNDGDGVVGHPEGYRKRGVGVFTEITGEFDAEAEQFLKFNSDAASMRAIGACRKAP